MNKKLLIAIIVIVLAAAALWWWQSQVPAAPSAEETGSDDTATISQELDAVDLGDLDKEFQTIDADLNAL